MYLRQQLPILALFLLASNSYGQKNYSAATIRDFYFFRPDYNDSSRILYYPSGQLKFEQTSDYDSWYYYADTTLNNHHYSVHLMVSRHPFDGCHDSTKYEYQYTDGKAVSVTGYEKICYRENSGCIHYDNADAGKWHLVSKVYFSWNGSGDQTELIAINHGRDRFDTTILTFENEYDMEKRKTKVKRYEDGALMQSEVITYDHQLKQVDLYFPEDSLPRITTVYKYADDILIEKLTDRKFIGKKETERYLYISKDRLYSIEYIGDDNNLYKVRKYFYD